MLEITGDDIKELNDADLRSLVGLLCEAEIRDRNLPVAGVTWGGHQNAPDGGIDVRVNLTTELENDGYIPRSKTGFQVKKPDMNSSAILREMKPNNVLRNVIKELADEGGAYIIVSSQGSTADSALTDRKKTMVQALSRYNNSSQLKVDFYDRERLAGWVRSHPSLILWVRDKIGRPIQGWKSYSNWAGNSGEDEYFLDEHLRLYNSANSKIEGLSPIDGIKELQGILKHPRSAVRLVGLSGVGKTRFVQALFEDSISETPLNKNRVFYTDISYSPNPDPINFAERIIALRVPAILIIDNCPPDLHKRLITVCSSPGCLISLLTVEYDVRDDYPEETEVYRLEPASNGLIERLISSRFTHVSQVDSHTIANFSGGNARIAIALANTIRRGENLGKLRDNELFLRLFQQRNQVDQNLQRVAEVCSLVYSFNIQTVEGHNNELQKLGSLIGLSVNEMYQNVRELQRRNLVQIRGDWRAVLPHAIANRLAGMALENIPLESVLNVFENDETTRLLKSFSRRLSYLHESEEARQIARKWLSEEGILGDVANLNDLRISLLQNIAPICEEEVLLAFERVLKNHKDNADYFSRTNKYYHQISSLLRSLAYDRDFFVKSVLILSKIALSEKINENYNSIRSVLKSLFYLYLSGTHATPEQRLAVIKKLIETGKTEHIELGISLLSSALEACHFSSHYGFEFGAHSRDYGYSPTSREQEMNWYKIFIEYAASLSTSESSYATIAKSLLAEKFRGLWVNARMFDILEIASNSIGEKSAWREGWLAVKSTIRFDGTKMDRATLKRLNTLAEKLEPIKLIERARLYALSNSRSALDLEDLEDLEVDYHDAFNKAEDISESLGIEIGANEQLLQELLPELLSNEGSRVFSFGKGLAKGCSNPEEMWWKIREHLLMIEENMRNYQLLRGFLQGISLNDYKLVHRLLDMVVIDDILGKIYPYLQVSIDINSKGVERIIQSINIGNAPIWQYNYLGYGRYLDSIDDNDFCELLEAISQKTEGVTVAIDIMNMRLHGHQEQRQSEVIVNLGQTLVLNFNCLKDYNRVDSLDYKISNIIKACFFGNNAKENARKLCKKFILAIENYEIYPRHYNDTLRSLASAQPIIFLDCFLGGEEFSHRLKGVFTDDINTLQKIEPDTIMNWCNENPVIRFPIISSAIIPYQKNEETGVFEWTTLATEILQIAENPIEILERFKDNFRPNSWGGSLANIMLERKGLITILKAHEKSVIVDWAEREEIKMVEEIEDIKKWELKMESDRNERFE